MLRQIYPVLGQSDAPPGGEEQRLPLNGWCDLKGVIGQKTRHLVRIEEIYE